MKSLILNRKCGILNPKKRVVVGEVGEGGEIGWTDIDDPTKVSEGILLPDHSSRSVKSLISSSTKSMKFL